MAADLTADDYDDWDGYEPDPDDWDERSYPPEPDPEDYEIARAYEEYAEHCEQAHGGSECDCRPSPFKRLAWRAQSAGRSLSNGYYRACYAGRRPWTLRLGPAEITVRLRADRACGACSGRGWFYTLSAGRPDDRPPGYNGVGLCGCGSAAARLADARRAERRARKEAPF